MIYRKKPNMSARITAGTSTYMSYLLRYVPSYPVTVEKLQKMATSKNFPRLVNYFKQLPPERSYQSAQEVLDHFKQIKQQQKDEEKSSNPEV